MHSKNHRRKFCVSIVFLFFTLLSTNTVYAFKVNTHVWIGQQVLNDVLDDGYVSIPFKDGSVRRIKVRDSIVQAMTKYQATFRMGNIGPDAFPDIYTGQMYVHPGTDQSKWKTDDWLRYFLSSDFTKNEQGLAFFYGYLGHAAADVFAHTYVNQYSGSIFEILSELNESNGTVSLEDAMAEEFRHFELEKFISSYDPPILDNNGNNLGASHKILATPSIFLRDRLIFNDQVALQNPVYLSLIHSLRKNLNGLGAKELDQMDIWAMQIVVYYYTSYQLTDEQAAKLVAVAKDINTFVSENNGVEESQKAKDKMVASVSKLVTLSTTITDKLDQAILDIYSYITKVNTLKSKIVTAKGQLSTATIDLAKKQADLLKAQNDLANTAQKIIDYVSCPPAPPLGPAPPCITYYKINPAYTALQSLINTLTNEIAALNTSINSLETSIASLEFDLSVAQSDLQKAKDVKQATTELIAKMYLTELGITNDVTNGVVNMLQQVTSDINPIRAMLDGWVKDIEKGMDEYIKTSEEVIKQTMFTGGDAIKPLQDWLDCWAPVLTGTPSAVTVTTCSVTDRINDLMTALDSFERKMMQMTSVTAKIQAVKDRISIGISQIKRDLAIKLVTEVLNVPIKKLLKLFTDPPSDEGLRQYFATDLSTNKYKGLLEIPDIPDRIRSEMHSVGQQYDPQKFNVIYNAVIFAKIALLDGVGLNQLACGLSKCITVDYGTSLYPSSSIHTVNVLLDSIKSIDGNHQWMPTAPPYPRRADYRRAGFEGVVPSPTSGSNFADVDKNWPLKSSYGYSRTDGKGFRLWQDCNYRNQIFRKIFHGPLNPALETPTNFGFKDILTKRYKNNFYNVTAANPFPSGDSWNNQCGEQDQIVVVDPNDLDSDGLLNSYEVSLGTDPNNSDTDGDGMSDFYEVKYGLSPLDPTDAITDNDTDGLTNYMEYLYSTSPILSDTDNDGLSDYQELIVYKTKPLTKDSDLDGMDDKYEIDKGFDPNNPLDALYDKDNDGLNNFKEYLVGTDPFKADTDGDGIGDQYEVTWKLDPLSANDASLDPDNDGLTNLQESKLNTNPFDKDTDGDGMDDLFESLYGLNPTLNDAAADLDGDGISNLVEYQNGTDPSGASEKPLQSVKAIGKDKKVSLSWKTVAGARSYNIYWSTAPGVTRTTGTQITNITRPYDPNNPNAVMKPYDHTGLKNGKRYYYVVTAVNAFGESPISKEVMAIPDDGLMLIIPLESVPGSGVFDKVIVLP